MTLEEIRDSFNKIEINRNALIDENEKIQERRIQLMNTLEEPKEHVSKILRVKSNNEFVHISRIQSNNCLWIERLENLLKEHRDRYIKMQYN